MVCPKKQGFWPRINILKGNHCILWLQWITVCQKVWKLYFQSWFSMSKINGIFLNLFFIDEYQFRRPLLARNFFSNFNFEPLYFLKSCPIFDKLAFPVLKKCNGFLWVCWFLDKNLAFRTHHLWNSTTELTILHMCLFWFQFPCNENVTS